MKVLYISRPSFADCDFPLIREYQRKGLDVTYLISLQPFLLRSTLFNIREQIPDTKIINATAYTEIKAYGSYMDLNKVYIANRPAKNSISLSYWKYLWKLYWFVKRGNFDVIHCDFLLSPQMKFLFGLTDKWVQTIHDPFPHSGEVSSKKIQSYNTTISGADRIFLLNEKQKESFCEYYNVDPDKVKINCLGVYDNIKAFVKSDHQVKKNNILFFGRLSPYKGVEYLCEAMTMVREQIPDATLTIAGGGNMYFDIERYKDCGYIELINRYVGMEELAGLLSRCEFTVCPYTDATQSGVVMTSFSLGKPVIATNVGGLPEMVADGKSGLLIPPRDTGALAQAIICLLSDKSRIKHMSDNIRQEYSMGDRSWDRIAERYIAEYLA